LHRVVFVDDRDLYRMLREVARRARDLGRAVPPDAERLLASWLEEARAWNQRLDLTAARTDEVLSEILLLDVLHLDPMIPPGARVIDVGTGAGAPGLGLALLRPDLRVICVEPQGKRVAFLRTVVGGARIEDRVQVVAARVSATEPALPAELSAHPPPDLAISRATFPPETWAQVGLSLAKEAILMLVDEAPALPTGARTLDDRRYVVPSSGAPRRLLKIARGGP
jgi:16S rRNA (guanine527-N7)-methyltransferase